MLLQRIVTGVLRKAASHHRSKPFAMRNGAPIASFTFDDVPDTAYLNGAAILDDLGVVGTFYIASGTCGAQDTDWRVISGDQVRALYERGHEIGCHTFSHVRVDHLDARALDEECSRNSERLRELCPGIRLTNFCYPFGKASLPRKLALQRRFDSCRGIYEGVNAGKVDLGMLRVIELYDRTLSPEKLQHVLRRARERNGWIVFYTHDVTSAPSQIGCSPQVLRATIEAAMAAGLECLSIRRALAAIGYKSAVPHAAISGSQLVTS